MLDGSNDKTIEKSANKRIEYSYSRLETEGNPTNSISKRSKKGGVVSYCKKSTSKGVKKRGSRGKLSPEQSSSLKHISKGIQYTYEKHPRVLDSSMNLYLSHNGSLHSPYINGLIKNLNGGSKINLSQAIGQTLNDRNRKVRKKLSSASGYLRTNRSNSPK